MDFTVDRFLDTFCGIIKYFNTFKHIFSFKCWNTWIAVDVFTFCYTYAHKNQVIAWRDWGCTLTLIVFTIFCLIPIWAVGDFSTFKFLLLKFWQLRYIRYKYCWSYQALGKKIQVDGSKEETYFHILPDIFLLISFLMEKEKLLFILLSLYICWKPGSMTNQGININYIGLALLEHLATAHNWWA